MEENENQNIVISWTLDGTAFVVYDHARFASEFLPTHFGHNQLRSFDRQLNYWDFQVISSKKINNKSFGGKSWKHPFFQKDRRDLLQKLTRKIVGSSSSKPSSKPKSNSVAVKAEEMKGRVVNVHRKIIFEGSESVAVAVAPVVAAPARKDNTNKKMRLKIPSTNLKELSMALDLPRTVSPDCSPTSCASSDHHHRQRYPSEVLAAALNVVTPDASSNSNSNSNINSNRKFSSNDVAAANTNDFATNIEDDFLPLFPLEWFKDDDDDDDDDDEQEAKAEAEAVTETEVDTKDIDPIPLEQQVVVDTHPIIEEKDNDNWDDLFEGNCFHDIGVDVDVDADVDDANVDIDVGIDVGIDVDIDADMDMDMNMNMNMGMEMDEEELLMNIIEKDDDDDRFLSTIIDIEGIDNDNDNNATKVTRV